MLNKELCLKLAYCETENDVINILDSVGCWNDESSWRYYGDNENNFSTIGNQQNNPDTALVEKIVNSVDAVLMSECFIKGQNPIGKDSPQSINKALEEYFNIQNGKLSNLSSSERSQLAEKICLVATGEKTNPCYIIVDQGEGQTPTMMPTTLLSIAKSNKLRIPFVQGKFNMGGTGIFQFCGCNNLQLIISKRHPGIANTKKDATFLLWGFTVVRRENPSKGFRSSIYKYLAPNNNILSFNAESLPILPMKYPKAYGRPLRWGTFIKLYEYQMPGLKSNVQFDLYNRLSILLPSIALPVRLYERRSGYRGHSFETTLSGLTVRLDEDKYENLEKNFPNTSSLTVQGQKMRISIFAFKRGKSDKYTKNEGIIFIINGQTQGYIPKSFFNRQNVQMGYLADSILIIVDCTDFDTRSREDLFMNSRDRLRACDLKSKIEKELEEIIRNHHGLRSLRENRRREDINDKLEDSKPLIDILETIISKSPSLSTLFIQGGVLPNPFNIKKTQKSDVFFSGKLFPTFFKLTHEFIKDRPKHCPINVRLRVQYRTDVENNYFNRDKDPGSFLLRVNGKETTNYSINLWNGVANLNVNIPNGAKVGDVFHFHSQVIDNSKVESLDNDFYIIIGKEIQTNRGGNGRRKPGPSSDIGTEVESYSGLKLPNVIEVEEDEWNLHGFNRESALLVRDSGDDGYDFYINMNNVHLMTEKKSKTSTGASLIDARYKYGMVLIGIALLKEYSKKCSSLKNLFNEDNGDITEIIKQFSMAISPILLPLITGLGELDESEIIKEYEEF